MRKQISMVTLKVASEQIGLATDTMRKYARSGKYPSSVMKKVRGTWMVDTEEWDRWHREQIH